MTTALRLDQIQSEVLFGYNRNAADRAPADASYLFVRFRRSSACHDERDLDVARRLLRAARVCWAADFRSDAARVNVGLTHRGLEMLLPTAAFLRLARERPLKELGESMAARADLLGDHGASAPETWTFSDGAAAPDGLSDVDAVFMVFGPSPESVAERLHALQTSAVESGAVCLRQQACALEDDREHFGYVDGISQPAIEGLSGSVEGFGAIDERGRWRPIKPGEIVLGYDDEEKPFGGPGFLEDGSFFVVRKLEQDVRAFHEVLRAEADRIGSNPGHVAGLMMGRDLDGSPLIDGGPSRNAFRYAPDGEGSKCPFGAHIRRANPRDASGRIGGRSERHRMVRRGMTYAEDAGGAFTPERISRGHRVRLGAPISDTEAKERRWGLMFGCFVASIERQFEVVQGGWMNGGETAPRKLFTPDPIAGSHPVRSHFVAHGRPAKVLERIGQYTSTRGGAYFFVPGRRAYAELCGLPEAAPRLRSGFVSRTSDAAVAIDPPTGVYRTSATTMPELRSSPRPERSEGIREKLRRLRRRRDWLSTPAVPEAQVLLLLSPIQPGKREDVERTLSRTASLDEALSGMAIHHARFCVTTTFFEMDPDADVIYDEPRAVGLSPDGGPYLFFGCWFDGPREALFRKLAERSDALPFRYCSGGDDGGADPVAFSQFVRRHEQPVLFAYQAYSAPKAIIQRALGVRKKFVDLVANLLARGATDAPIEVFFDRSR